MKVDPYNHSRLVAYDELPRGYSVSTVLLTLGHAFETLVRDEKGQEEESIETKDREQALDHHVDMMLKYCEQLI